MTTLELLQLQNKHKNNNFYEKCEDALTQSEKSDTIKEYRKERTYEES